MTTKILAAAATLFINSAAAHAQPGDAGPSDWTLRFTTYSWASWLSGKGGVAGRTFDVDVNPIEIVDHLDWDHLPVWMSYAEARNGRLSLFNDIVYARLTGSAEFAKASSRRFSSLSLGGDAEADAEMATVELGAGYEVARWTQPSSQSFTALDFLAGARYWHQEVDLSVDVTATLNLLGLTLTGNRAIARSGSVDWVDPFIGARIRHQLAAGEEIVLRGDIGGFDVGSDFSWHAIATYSWNLGSMGGLLMDGYIGYRALSVDYEQGEGLRKYEFDVIQHGPVIGMTTRF